VIALSGHFCTIKIQMKNLLLIFAVALLTSCASQIPTVDNFESGMNFKRVAPVEAHRLELAEIGEYKFAVRISDGAFVPDKTM
jgi:hypothetical protein